MVQLTHIGSQAPNDQECQVGAFGRVLAQQAIGVLIGAAFPCVIRMSEEDRQAEPAFELGRTSELAAVVQRQAVAFSIRISSF
jgi:predicted membrane-bound spermidine synthase